MSDPRPLGLSHSDFSRRPGNRITKIEGLEALTELEELYLSHNGLTKIEGLSGNVPVSAAKVVFPADPLFLD